MITKEQAVELRRLINAYRDAYAELQLEGECGWSATAMGAAERECEVTDIELGMFIRHQLSE